MTSAKTIRRENHYVPTAYLRRWTDDSGRLWAYRFLVSHPNVPAWKRRSPGGIAYHTHLYTRAAAPAESDEIEKWLDSEFEAPGTQAIQRAVSGSKLTSGDWSRLIRFLAAQDVRTPARLVEMLKRWNEDMQDVVTGTLSKTVQKLKDAHREGKKLETQSDPDARYFPSRVTIEKYPGSNEAALRVEAIVGRGMWLFAMRHLLKNTVQALLKHRWTILRSPPNVEWLTSDRPVVCLNYHSATRYDFRGGWGNTGTEIFLPLSPKHLMYTQVGSKPRPRGTVLSVPLASTFQKMIVENAHRYVFATKPDPFVDETRPRVVDPEAFEAEAGQWKRWHDEQSAAEVKYYSQ